jgi:ribosome-associated protein
MLMNPDTNPTLSKTKRKQISHELQALGKALGELPRHALKQLELPEPLTTALLEWQDIKAHEGKRRQLQLIGKLMRSLDDALVETLKQRLDNDAKQSREQTAQFHRLERWRERLLEDDAVLTEWMTHYPQTDVQHLRTLIRQARKEQTGHPPLKAYRELFQALKNMSQFA